MVVTLCSKAPVQADSSDLVDIIETIHTKDCTTDYDDGTGTGTGTGTSGQQVDARRMQASDGCSTMAVVCTGGPDGSYDGFMQGGKQSFPNGSGPRALALASNMRFQVSCDTTVLDGATVKAAQLSFTVGAVLNGGDPATSSNVRADMVRRSPGGCVCAVFVDAIGWYSTTRFQETRELKTKTGLPRPGRLTC